MTGFNCPGLVSELKFIFSVELVTEVPLYRVQLLSFMGFSFIFLF